MTRRAIAATVAFLIGWTVFQIVTPVQEIVAPVHEIAIPDMPDLRVRSITLRHHGCTDAEQKCPVFDVTFRSDGTATYVGYANDDCIGTCEGTIEEVDFNHLVEQIEKQQFFEFPSDYTTDDVEEEKTLEVVTSEGLRTVKFNNWSSTPIELRMLDVLIAEQSYHMYWDEAK